MCCGDPIGGKNDATHCLSLSAPRRLKVWASRELSFIDFNWIRAHLGLERPVESCGAFWVPVAEKVLPLQDYVIREYAFCRIRKLNSAGWDIVRYCSNGSLEFAGLEGVGGLQM